MKHEFECQKCGEICNIDGYFPKYFCFCEQCNDYAQGFDPLEYSADYFGGYVDWVCDTVKDR